MSELKQPESTRTLLAEIEGDWDAPKSGATKASAPTPAELHAELDAAADRLVESLEPPASTRDLTALDSGWGDTDENDDEDEAEGDDADDEANEPALPDEQLDPVAYAAAKKARDERIEARRERRRAKNEAKKARRKARAEAQRSKQKPKQRKARAPQRAARPERSAKPKARERSDDDASESTAHDDDDVPATSAPVRARAKGGSIPASSATKPMLSRTNQWMLAIAIIVFVAAATFAAVVAR
jgi:hypothetical protein